MDKTLAIRFKVPLWYTVQDVLKYLNKEVPMLNEQDPKKYLHLVAIEKDKALVIFSSLFYYLKVLRFAAKNQDTLDIIPSISEFHPISVSSLQLICNNSNNEHICLQELSGAFLIIERNSENPSSLEMLLSFTIKGEEQTELLAKVKAVKAHTFEAKDKFSKNYFAFTLIEPAELYRYYALSNDTKLKGCIRKYRFSRNSQFYTPLISWNINQSSSNSTAIDSKHIINSSDAEDTPLLNILSPLFEVHKSINAAIMFTNMISVRLHAPISDIQKFCEMCDPIDVEKRLKNITLKQEEIEIESKPFQVEWYEDIRSLFVWLSVNKTGLIFPFLARIFDFKHPALGVDINTFSDEVDSFLEEGTTNWIMERVIMAMDNMNVDELEQKITALEDKYEQGGFDIDDESSMPSMIYNLKIQRNAIYVSFSDANIVTNGDFIAMQQVSSCNYVISVASGCNRLRQHLICNGFTLTDAKQRNEIMHYLKAETNYISYGATILNNPLSDEKFIQYYKSTMEEDTAYLNDDDNEQYIVFNDEKEHKEPPHKKRKTMHVKEEKLSENPYINVTSTEIISIKPQSPESEAISDRNSPLIIPKYFDSNDCVQTSMKVMKVQSPKSITDDIDPQITNQKQSISFQADDKSTNSVIKTDDKSTNNVIKSDAQKPIHEPILNDTKSPTSDSENKAIIAPRSFSAKTNETLFQTNEESFAIEDNKPLKRKRKRKIKKIAAEPISFTKLDHKAIKSTPIKSASKAMKYDTKIRNLEIKDDGSGWAFGVPIYNSFYFDCADFGEINIDDFARKVRALACRTDLEIVRDLRASRGGRSRRRAIRRADEADCQFMKDVHNAEYRDLFMDCFTVEGDHETLDIDLREWEPEGKLRMRDGRAFVIYDHGCEIRTDRKERLYLLLRIYWKHTTIGCLDFSITPPWLPPMDCIVSGVTAMFKVIDLTEVKSDDDEMCGDTMKSDTKEIEYKNVKVKMEIESDSDSDWD